MTATTSLPFSSWDQDALREAMLEDLHATKRQTNLGYRSGASLGSGQRWAQIKAALGGGVAKTRHELAQELGLSWNVLRSSMRFYVQKGRVQFKDGLYVLIEEPGHAD